MGTPVLGSTLTTSRDGEVDAIKKGRTFIDYITFQSVLKGRVQFRSHRYHKLPNHTVSPRSNRAFC